MGAAAGARRRPRRRRRSRRARPRLRALRRRGRRGPPAPVAPTEHLVVGGLYRGTRAIRCTSRWRRSSSARRSCSGVPRCAAVRRRLRGRHRGVRALVRGAGPAGALRRRVRGLPPRGAGLVAQTARVAPGRRRRVGRHSERPKPCCVGPACSRTQRTSGVAASSSFADRAAGLRTVQPCSEGVPAGHRELIAAQQVPAADGRPDTRAERARARASLKAAARPPARGRSPA